MAEADLRVVTQIGQQYVGICDQFLSEQLGRPYTMPEIVQFAETAISTLLASAYANFRDALGKDESEAWLKKTLAVSGATVRQLGADALVRFEVHVKDAPNSLHKARQEMQAQPAKPVEAPKCTCTLDKDGACTDCTNALAEGFKSTFQFMRNMAEFGKKNENMCPNCRVSQTDRALVTIIPDALAIKVPDDQKEAAQQHIFGLLHQIGASQGAAALPLTEKAWKEAVKA
jgi:hypothetical protein